ncbi:hypothetical protein LUX29_12410 [Aureimonas altamirensis]|jgi:hypothetical protein|uniref:hypothetical protein n=1 Tax=Aureimonas altamirensis TaxID=370622 RepID=UPI001E2B503C|nr:hypothetical protein [Aureimonas altamirensis]UHD43892.1 hypothetical protein LUX29_12410 [Aureimonas altamirensis]
MESGLYLATYRIDGGDPESGYAVVGDGRIYCLNRYQGFSGSYVIIDGKISGTIRLVHTVEGMSRRANIVVNFDGLARGKTVIIQALAKDAYAVPLEASMHWISA